MSIAVIIAVILAVILVLRITYVMWFNNTLKRADQAMRKGNHWTAMAELSLDRIQTYNEYATARRFYRRAARLYLSLGLYSDARFAVWSAVQAGKMWAKYFHM